MAFLFKGKFFSLYLIFLLSSPSVFGVLVTSNSVLIPEEHTHNSIHESQTGSEPTFDKQEVLLEKLDEIVRNLNQIVTRLESKLSGSSSLGNDNTDHSLKLALVEKEKIDQIKEKYDGKISINEVQEGDLSDKVRDGERARLVTVTKYSPFWSERFQFVSAVKLDSQATCIDVLPFRDYEGLSKYAAVGDERGRVYVFLRNGDVLVEYFTLSDSPITAMLSFMSVYKNESFVITGHQNGAVLMHRVWEGSSGEEWSSVFMENVVGFMRDGGEDGLPITLLEVHHVGRMRYILTTDISGEIRVFKENGTLYGRTKPSSRPLAFLKQRLLFLTESGAGSLDLRNMKIRESECEGLNHSLARNYVFDATERSKAYGCTKEGDLIHVLLLGDIVNFKCRVRSKRKFEMHEPLAFHAIKGYLLAVNEEKVQIYNVSSHHYVRAGAPRILFSTGLDEIKASFLNYQITNIDIERSKRIPLIASDHEKLVLLSLGGGYIGMYRSNLPIYKGEYSTMLWTSPVLLFILFLFGAWHLFAKKKEALTSWAPDDPFSSTSVTSGAPVGGTASGDKSFIDSSSRNADKMDIRGGSGLRGPPRRYVSPPRYAGGATSSLRPASADHGSRPTAVDPNFRSTTSELKYRGSSLEPPPGFPKKRVNLYGNNQGVDDSS